MRLCRREPLRLLVVALALAVCGSGAAASAPAVSVERAAITVSPATALVDTPVRIQVSGVRPHSVVTVRATTRDGIGRAWRSSASFRADAAGQIDLTRTASRSGAYRGRDGMALFWSMRPPDSRNPPDRASLFPPEAGFTVRFELVTGGRRVASTTAIRRSSAETVTSQALTLEREGFVGRFYAAPSTKPAPALLLLGGSDGGLTGRYTGPLFASHGFPTLALAYFGVAGLPANLENIPLEYFVRALEWLRGQPGVDPERVFVLGVSRGSEAALLLGALYPHLVYGVVGYVPSSVVNPSPVDVRFPAWTHNGKPIPHVTADEYRDPNPTKTPQAVIPVERTRGPVFLVSGVEDQLWPSSSYAAAIVSRLKANGRGDFVSLTYGHAGHAVGAAVPFLPIPTVLQSRRYGTVFDMGGTRAGDARARADSWPKLLRHLERARR